jgi:hypothetical protein
MAFTWTPARMDQLERAARESRRVAIVRRGNEFIVVARRIVVRGKQETFIGVLPMTGEEIAFDLIDVDDFQVVE